MFSIEENEISDRSIMEATQIAEDVHGRVQFRTTLPSGRPLNSEWIQASDKGKAGVLWAEAVRAQIVSDTQEAAAIAKRTLKEQRAQSVTAPKLVGTNGETLSTPVVSQSALPTWIPATRNVQVDADPAVYVRSQYLQARAMATFWEGELAKAQNEYREASNTAAKWHSLLMAMGGSVGDNPSNAITMGGSVEQSQGRGRSNSPVSAADAGSNVVQQVVVSSSQAGTDFAEIGSAAITEYEDSPDTIP